MLVVVKVTRDSVAAGDDVDAPHERTLKIEPAHDPSTFITQTAHNYLASVSGRGHTWDAILNGNLVATITVDEIIPRVASLEFGPVNDLHFEYHSATW